MTIEQLANLRWSRIVVSVQNQRAVGAEEHPLWVLHGLLMYAMPDVSPGVKFPLCFKPLTPVGETVEKGRTYELAVLFPTDQLTVPESFARRLHEHLENSIWNFSLVRISAPEARSLADIHRESPTWPSATEVCLDFISPCAYTPSDSARKWMFSSDALGWHLAHRLSHFFSKSIAHLPSEWSCLETNCAYWDFAEYPHRAKSGPGQGHIKTIAGNVGPLYLRGPADMISAISPWLMLGAELGCGLKLGPRGHFRLDFARPYFDPILANPKAYLAALERLHQRSDLPDDFSNQLGESEKATDGLARMFETGSWQPGAAKGFATKKANGASTRLIVQLSSADRLVHQTLHAELSPRLDRLFEAQSHGFRIGMGVEGVRQFVLQAWSRGYTVVAEADVESFFDSVPWDRMEAQIRRHLPQADIHTIAALHALLRTPVRLNRRTVRRNRGLLQGSPLSPLLANLYLDPFDEQMTARGHCLVRYADDFIVLGKTDDEARAALAAAAEILAQMGLALNPQKTAITPFSKGFTFLGLRFGGGISDELIEATALEKTLFVRHPHAWVGIDQDSITVKEGIKLRARLPLRRVREVILLGVGGVSSRLVERCAQRGISISFCSAAGRHLNTLSPSGYLQYRRGVEHSRRHAALSEPTRLACARGVVAAKLNNYASWFRERLTAEARPIFATMEQALALLPEARSDDQLRGIEGMAAREVFSYLNHRAPEGFRSTHRRPGEGADPWNILLDFAYSLLFQRLNLLLRLRGLNPFLGFLHSPENRYESLVCDLQEPFRARCDRFVLKLVNRQQIRIEEITEDPLTGWRLEAAAAGRFLELFAQELDTRLASEPANWARLIDAQVLMIERWVVDDTPVSFFHANSIEPPGDEAVESTGPEWP